MEGTRRTDDPETARRIKEARRSGRKFTILYSVLSAGIVSLLISHYIEVESANSQIDRSRTNCELTQSDRWDRVDSLRESAAAAGAQADSVLGNKHPIKYIPPRDGEKAGTLKVGKPIPAANFEKPPFSQFKSFKALSIQNAQAQRSTAKRNFARAKNVQSRIEDCNKVFPKRGFL